MAEDVSVVVVQPIEPRDLDDVEFSMRATELHALIAWARGGMDRTGFRRVLRAERWPEGDIGELTAVVEHIFATEGGMPRHG
jgi:hypothetical protein